MNQQNQQSNFPVNGVGGNGIVPGGMQPMDASMQMNCGYYYPYGMSMMSSPMQMSNNPYMNSLTSPMLMNQFAQLMSMMGNGMNMQGMQYPTNQPNQSNPLYSSSQTTPNAPPTLQSSSNQGQSQVILLSLGINLSLSLLAI